MPANLTTSTVLVYFARNITPASAIVTSFYTSIIINQSSTYSDMISRLISRDQVSSSPAIVSFPAQYQHLAEDHLNHRHCHCHHIRLLTTAKLDELSAVLHFREFITHRKRRERGGQFSGPHPWRWIKIKIAGMTLSQSLMRQTTSRWPHLLHLRHLHFHPPDLHLHLFSHLNALQLRPFSHDLHLLSQFQVLLHRHFHLRSQDLSQFSHLSSLYLPPISRLRSLDLHPI